MKQLLKYILTQVFEQQKQAETKLGVVIALIGGVAVVMLNVKVSNNIYIKIVWYCAFIFCVLALIVCLVAVKAKKVQSRRYKKSIEDINYIFYEDIKDFMPGQYLLNIAKAYNFPKDYLPDNFELDLAKSIVSLSKRVYTKNKLLNISFMLLVISFSFLFAWKIIGAVYATAL